ncbi:helix-turn-helix domain-containing protein [Pseudomonas hormoni]
MIALDIGVAFGRVLRQKRQESGLTQEQLALEADVQRNYVSLIERGVNQPTIAVLFKLANALKCSPSTLIRLVEEELG